MASMDGVLAAHGGEDVGEIGGVAGADADAGVGEFEGIADEDGDDVTLGEGALNNERPGFAGCAEDEDVPGVRLLENWERLQNGSEARRAIPGGR
jgi:hypothetical protein